MRARADRGSTRWLATALVVGLCATLAAGTATAQLDRTTLRGRVLDNSGMPLVGALVAVQPADGIFRERLVFTDHAGLFSVPELLSGQYSIRVTKARFLPTVEAIDLERGGSMAMTLSLQTAIDVITRGVRRGSLEDMKWVLRSSPSTRPVLRMTGGGEPDEIDPSPLSAMETSGHFQLYSTSIETPVGSSDSVGSQFSFNLPLALDSQVVFSGQYSESVDQPRGFGAEYQFSPSDDKRSTLAVNVRQGAMLNGASSDEARELKVEYGEKLQWSDRLLLSYGAAIGRAEGLETHSYIRPELGVMWVPEARTTLHTVFSKRAPIDPNDPIRGREYFDRTVYIPPDLEEYSHVEFGATHTISEFMQVSAAAFRDVLGTQAFLVDSDDGRRAIMIFDSTDSPTTGVRFHVNRDFQDFEAGVGYTFASAIGFAPDVQSPEELRAEAHRENVHVVTARLKTDIELTQTEVTAVYRWVSGFSLAPVDPYQVFAEYNDPTLSITIAQDLPTWSVLPAKFQAVVDARNLFEPSFGSRRTVQARYPRLLKGGIHIRF